MTAAIFGSQILNNAVERTVFAEDHTITTGPPGSYSLALNLKNVQLYGDQFTSADELGVSTQTLYRHVSPSGELRGDGKRVLRAS